MASDKVDRRLRNTGAENLQLIRNTLVKKEEKIKSVTPWTTCKDSPNQIAVMKGI